MAAGKKRIYLLDELRGLAVFCMVFYHAFYSMSEFFGFEIGTKLLDFFTPAEPFFAALFIVYVDCAARAAHRTAAKETPLWAACWMALAAAYPLYGYQPGPLGDWQWMVWHLFAVWYVLARCGMLAQGQSGSLAPLDALAGFVLLPFGNFFLRARTVFAALRTHLQDRTGIRKVLRLIVTAAVTLALCGVAWGLLAAADANFAALGQQVSDWWGRLLNNVRFIDQLMYILHSLPVGAWLYGLVGGSLRRKAPPTTAQQCAAVLENCRIVPRTTAVAAVMALCGVYALFFACLLYTSPSPRDS